MLFVASMLFPAMGFIVTAPSGGIFISARALFPWTCTGMTELLLNSWLTYTAPPLNLSGSSTSLVVSNESELKIVTAFSLGSQTDKILSLAIADVLSISFSILSLDSIYILCIPEPGSISWNWCRRSSFQQSPASLISYSAPLQTEARTPHISISLRASSARLLLYLTFAWDV